MAKRKKEKLSISPDIRTQEKKRLERNHRQTILFNEKEISLINQYCQKFNIQSKSSFFRNTILAHVLEQLDDSHPTLF